MANSNNEQIEPLSLPRLDWYDSEGRINKTALIENFNAIEEKLSELSNLALTSILIPDFNYFSFDDTTLESDDNRIVNLRSFIDIMNLKGMPLVITFDDKVLTKLQYYNDSYSRVEITNVNLSELGVDGKVYIYLDYSEDMVYISDDGTNPNNDVLIACYDDGVIHTLSSFRLVDVNILEVLANMKSVPVSYNSLTEVANRAGVTDGKGYRASAYNGARTIGLVCRESGGANYPLTFRDFGV